MNFRKPHPLFMTNWPLTLSRTLPLTLMFAAILFAYPSGTDTLPGPAPNGSVMRHVQPEQLTDDTTVRGTRRDSIPLVLKVVTGEFRAVKGDLIIELSDSTGEAFTGGIHPVTGTTVTVRFDSLAPGPKAVRLFHDENSNGKLDTNFFGIPSEGYGFSNNPRSRFGEPSFKDRLFELKADTTIHITLTYW